MNEAKHVWEVINMVLDVLMANWGLLLVILGVVGIAAVFLKLTKKKDLFLYGGLAFLFVGLVFGGAIGGITDLVGGDTLSAVGLDADDADEVKACDGISSINLLADDKNALAIGTDPGTTLTIYEKNGVAFSKTVADDATSTAVPVNSKLKILNANTLGAHNKSYFATFDEIETDCVDMDYQPKLYEGGTPTITIVNDNGVTSNADSSAEAMDASSVYTPCMTVKAPADQSASEFGAAVVMAYDATYVQNIDSTDMGSSSEGWFESHLDNLSANHNPDQFEVFKWDGVLRDGDKVEICFDVETTSSTPGEDEAAIQLTWVPLNNDLNADTLEPIMAKMYDEDRNLINVTSATAVYYTS